MKNKSLFLILLLAVFAPWAAQAQTLTIYDGEPQTTNRYVPIDGYNVDGTSIKSECVIPASQLTAMNGKEITQMTYYLSTVGNRSWGTATFKVFLKEVDFTTISSLQGLTGATVVYDTKGLDCTQSTMDVVFDDPYLYNGGNLLVGVYIVASGTYTGTSSNNGYKPLYAGQTVSGASYHSSGGQQNFIPKTTFTYQNPPAYPKPTNVRPGSVTGETATILWDAPQSTNTISGYTYNYKKHDVSTWSSDGSTLASVTEADIEELDPQTEYDFRVKALYEGNNESEYATTTFTTPCSSITTLPWSEPFEDMTANTVPECWDNSASTSSTLSSSPYYIWGVYSYGSGANANKMLRMYNALVKSGTALINTQPITLPAGAAYQLSFDYSHRANCSALLVKISEDGGTTFVQKGSYPKNSSTNNTTDPGTFATVEPILLSEYAGKTIIVQFYAEANYSNGAIFLDNVSIDLAPTCLKPTALGATEDQSNQSVLSWTDNNNTAPANGWTVYYKKTTDASYSSVSAPTNPFTLPDLTAATYYQYYVVANCASDDESDPSDVYSFRTACPEYKDVPFTENFDEITLSSAWTPSANTLPDCWDYINTCTNSSYKYYPTAYYYSSTDYSNSSPNSLRFYSSSSSDPQDQYAILPAVENVSELRIKLYARLYSTSYDGTFTIGVMTNPHDASTFTQVGDPLLPSGASYELFTVPFSSYTGTGTHIAIKMAAATSSYRSVFIDDITVEEIPSCVEPSGLAEVPETATDHSLTFDWTAGGSETNWKIQYKKSSEEEWTTYPDAVTTKPFELPGLEASSIYNVRVAAWCTPSNPEGISGYTDPVTATTECGAVTVDATHHYSDNFNDYTAGTTGTYVPSNYPNDELPLCWRFLNRSETTSTYPMVFLSSYSDYAVSGNCLFFKSSSSTPLYAILPEFTNNISDLMLTFTYRNEGTSASNGTLYVSYMTNPADATTFNTADAVACERTMSKKEMEVFFANAPAGSYIAFKYQGGSNNNMYLSIDDVKVELAPSCRKPSALACDSKTAHTATLRWTNGEATQDAWQIAYSTNSSFAPDADFTPGENEWLVDADANPFTVDNLAQSTTYYAYVRANCGGGNYSAWCKNKLTFSTVAGNVTPTGLAVAPATITSSQATASWNAVAGNTLHQSYDIYWATADVTSVPAEPAAPNFISGITATEQLIDGLDPETDYKVWVRDNCGTDGYSNWSSAVPFSTVAECQTPDGLYESEVTSNSAKITWNTYGKTEFNLAYSVDEGASWSYYTGITCPFTFPNDLQSNQPYQVKVQATCNTEAWSAVLNFRTECGAREITATEKYNEPFEDPVTTATYNSTTGLVVPDCWGEPYTNSTSYLYKKPHIISKDAGSSYNFSNPNSQVLFFYGADGYVALPEFTNISELQISFKWAVENKSYGTLKLGYITSEDNGTYNTFQDIASIAASKAHTAKTMQDTTIYLNTVPAAADRLVFLWTGTDNWYCNIDDVEVALLPSCYPVNNLTYNDVQANSVKLSWNLIDATQEAWQICVNDATPYTEVALADVTVSGNTVTYTLSGLDDNTPYTVKVRGNCGTDNYGDWSNSVNFTTPEACPAPTNLTVTPTQYTANVTWAGESDSYNIQYRTAATLGTPPIFSEDWSNGIGDWTRVDCHSSTQVSGNVFQFHWSDNPPQYLISPEITGIDEESILEFKYWDGGLDYEESFQVGYSTTTNEIASFTFGTEIETDGDAETNTYHSTVPAGTKYIAIKYLSDDQYYLYIDDIVIAPALPAGEWQPTEPISTTETSCQIPNLISGTKYDVRVQGVCGGIPGNWSTKTFETVPYWTFTTDGNWNVAANWTPSGTPGENDDVAINAAATIPANTVVKVDKINIYPNGSITLANSGSDITSSGQLWHSNAGVEATVNLHVHGYSSDKDNYHLIASPFAGSLALDGTSIVNTENAFDLYMFDQNYNQEEWRNYEANPKPFTALVNGSGYLYANNKENWNNFALTGELQPSNEDMTVTLSYVEGKQFTGWNLVGNPFACNAYIKDASSTEIAYYRMNTAGDGFTAATGAIAPMEGIFVKATEAGQSFKFSRTAPSAKGSQLNLNLSQGNNVVDNAIVRFDGGSTLEKFSFRQGSTKVFITEEGKDYAVVNAGHVGEIPVSFKAERNGSYTMSFTSQEVSFSYLHLVDNLTGNDVDLLANPSYSFDAQVTDFAQRFKLVFATGTSVDGDSFGFINGMGNLCIFGIEGEATIQVIDILGHVITSDTFSGSYERKLNVAPGVYMIRLINGNDVKVQKMVVR